MVPPMRKLEVLLEGGAFFEGPRWHEGQWWVSDMFADVVLAIDPSGHQREIMAVEAHPSGLGWLPDGSLLVVSMRDHRLLRRHLDATVTVHADISQFCGGWANDMVVDAVGRAYVGNLSADIFGADGPGEPPRSTVLVQVDPDGTAEVAAEELMMPNGSVITPDGSTLIVGETFGDRYTAFTIGPDGSLSDRRIWANFAPNEQRQRVGPDGCALDAEGHLWMADFRSGRCERIRPGGAVVDTIDPPPGTRFFACMLGGPDGRTFLGCASAKGPSIRSSVRDAVLVTTRVDVPHAGLP